VEGRDAPRCTPHNLAVGPDGLCVLCRQAALGARQPGSGQSGTVRGLAFGLVAACVLVLAFGVAKQFSDRADPVGAEPRPPQPPAHAANVPAAPEPRPESPAAVAAPAIAATIDTAANVGRDDPAGGVRVPGIGQPGEDQLRQAQQERGAATQPNGERQGRQTGLSEQDLRLWMRRVPVTMYATNWCPVCTKARAWLRQNDISFTELDVEKSEAANRAQRALNPKGSVPTLDIDGAVLVGFGPEAIQDAMRRAAERRARQ
jgi:glutaredoxin